MSETQHALVLGKDPRKSIGKEKNQFKKSVSSVNLCMFLVYRTIVSEPVTSRLRMYCKSIVQWREKFKIATIPAELTLKSVLKYMFFWLLSPLQLETLVDWHFSFQLHWIFLPSRVYATRNGFPPINFPVFSCNIFPVFFSCIVICHHFIYISKINTCTAQMTIHSHHSWQSKKSHTCNSVTTAIITYANKKREVNVC